MRRLYNVSKQYVEDLTFVIIYYEIYETSLGNLGKIPKLPNEFHKFHIK